MAYIYQITNQINGKIYIGKTEFSIEKRFKEHCDDAYRESKEKRPLYAAMRKYGIENFQIELLEETDSPEEREMYWIEQKQSFKNGYNATLGGDGRRYIDYDLVIATYQQLKSLKDTADALNIHVDSVHNILTARNIQIVSSADVLKTKCSKPVNMFTLQNEYLRSFPSTIEAARYMCENNLTGCKLTTIKQHIAEVCKGRRKTAAKFIWKYSE